MNLRVEFRDGYILVTISNVGMAKQYIFNPALYENKDMMWNCFKNLVRELLQGNIE